MSRLTRLTLIAPLCLTLAGCSFGPRLQGVAVNHNEMVANAANQVTFLNILRARAREPLHFTSISKLNGSATAGGKATGNVAARGPTATRKVTPTAGLSETSTVTGAEVVTPSLEASVTASSSFDVGVFDTQEFYQGIITSVPPGIIAHYLHQGWPESLLVMLFVGGIDIVAPTDLTLTDGRKVKKGQAVRTISNDAWGGIPATPMRKFMRCYELVSYLKETPDRKLIQVRDAGLDVAGLALLDGDKFDVDDPTAKGAPQYAEDRWIARKGKSGDALTITRRPPPKASRDEDDEDAEGRGPPVPPPSDDDCRALLDVSGLIPRGTLAADGVELGGGSRQGDFDKTQVGQVKVSQDGNELKFDIVLTIRSVDGLIYYLGECLRTHDTCRHVDLGLGDKLDVFVLTKEKPKQVFVSAEFRGERYFVPATALGNPTGGPDGGRSSQVIDLIQQLVNLQKNSKDRPSTATVRVVQ